MGRHLRYVCVLYTGVMLSWVHTRAHVQVLISMGLCICVKEHFARLLGCIIMRGTQYLLSTTTMDGRPCRAARPADATWTAVKATVAVYWQHADSPFLHAVLKSDKNFGRVFSVCRPAVPAACHLDCCEGCGCGLAAAITPAVHQPRTHGWPADEGLASTQDGRRHCGEWDALLLLVLPFCTLLFCTVLYCTVPYSTVPYSTVSMLFCSAESAG